MRSVIREPRTSRSNWNMVADFGYSSATMGLALTTVDCGRGVKGTGSFVECGRGRRRWVGAFPFAAPLPLERKSNCPCRAPLRSWPRIPMGCADASRAFTGGMRQGNKVQNHRRMEMSDQIRILSVDD